MGEDRPQGWRVAGVLLSLASLFAGALTAVSIKWSRRHLQGRHRLFYDNLLWLSIIHGLFGLVHLLVLLLQHAWWWVCQVGGQLKVFCVLAAISWYVVLGANIWGALHTRQQPLGPLQPGSRPGSQYALLWLGPLLASVIPAIEGGYGGSDARCWISRSADKERVSWLIVIVPLALCYGFCSFVFTFALCILPLKVMSGVRKRLIKRFSGFLMVIFLTWWVLLVGELGYFNAPLDTTPMISDISELLWQGLGLLYILPWLLNPLFRKIIFDTRPPEGKRSVRKTEPSSGGANLNAPFLDKQTHTEISDHGPLGSHQSIHDGLVRSDYEPLSGRSGINESEEDSE